MESFELALGHWADNLFGGGITSLSALVSWWQNFYFQLDPLIAKLVRSLQLHWYMSHVLTKKVQTFGKNFGVSEASRLVHG